MSCTLSTANLRCQVIQQLQQVDADVLSLQEVDISCERSSCKDTGAAIAQALQLNYLFICKMEHLQQRPGLFLRAEATAFAVSTVAALWEATAVEDT
jgi:endonuclease/exonuclease/phosphatase family metal-dependent hydrolase